MIACYNLWPGRDPVTSNGRGVMLIQHIYTFTLYMWEASLPSVRPVSTGLSGSPETYRCCVHYVSIKSVMIGRCCLSTKTNIVWLNCKRKILRFSYNLKSAESQLLLKISWFCGCILDRQILIVNFLRTCSNAYPLGGHADRPTHQSCTSSCRIYWQTDTPILHNLL